MVAGGDPRETCIEEPDGSRKCFPTDEETVIPARIEVGDLVSVRVAGGGPRK